MARLAGFLLRQERTKSRAVALYPSEGKSGGSPSTIAWWWSQQIVPRGMSLLRLGKAYVELTKDGRRYLWGIRVTAQGTLDNSQAQAPDVALNAVCAACVPRPPATFRHR